MRVAIATTPKQGAGGTKGVLDHDIELAKAAMLYADEVEMVGLSVSALHGLYAIASNESRGVWDLLASLDNDTITHMRGDQAQLDRDWRAKLEHVLAMDPTAMEMLDPAAAAQMREFQELMAEANAHSREEFDAFFEATGGAELVPAIKAGVVRIADLTTISPATVLRPRALGGTETLTDLQIKNWMDVLLQRLNDTTVRLLFDEDAAGLVRALISEGKISAPAPALRLAAQATLGAGFITRLPAFPGAPMDELLDLRRDLTAPLARYRGAVVKFSRDIPTDLGEVVEFEMQQLWESEVVPQLAELNEHLAEHGLVKELARAVHAQDIRNFGAWTAGTYLLLNQGADLGILASGMMTAAVQGMTRVGQVALDAYRARSSAASEARSNDFFYLYEANRRLIADG